MSDTPNQVRVALGVLALHGAPVTEPEYRELMRPVDCTVTAGYLMMQGYLKQTGYETEQTAPWLRWMKNRYELTERGLEALR